MQNEKSGTIKKLKFTYKLNAKYSSPITHHSFTVMFLPSDTDRQKINTLDIHISNFKNYCLSDDNFGNKKIYGLIEEAHDRFDVVISGAAETGLDIKEEYTSYPFEYSLLKTQTKLTAPGKKLIEYHRSLELDTLSGSYDKALHIMRTLPGIFLYDTEATEVHETAENALTIGKGVCQDYAHIMLSLLRMESIPARYAVGMMLGEGSSHAWVEVLCNGYWYGFDPTNNTLVNEDYIRVSCGRDSSDCSVIRGSFYGCVTQDQRETVNVEKI